MALYCRSFCEFAQLFCWILCLRTLNSKRTINRNMVTGSYRADSIHVFLWPFLIAATILQVTTLWKEASRNPATTNIQVRKNKPKVAHNNQTWQHCYWNHDVVTVTFLGDIKLFKKEVKYRERSVPHTEPGNAFKGSKVTEWAEQETANTLNVITLFWPITKLFIIATYNINHLDWPD